MKKHCGLVAVCMLCLLFSSDKLLADSADRALREQAIATMHKAAAFNINPKLRVAG